MTDKEEEASMRNLQSKQHGQKRPREARPPSNPGGHAEGRTARPPRQPRKDIVDSGYTRPSVNISLYDTPNPYIDNLKSAFAEFNIEFEAEQEAKRQAAIDAANAAAAAAAYGGSTWSSSGGNDPGGYTVSDGRGGSYRTDSSGTSGYSDPGGVVGMSDYE
jgi:hypothetical protein